MRIIDVHAHYVPPNPFSPKEMIGDETVVKRRALRAGITDSVILHVADIPFPDAMVEGIVQMLVADPHFYVMAGFAPMRPESWDFTAKLLQYPKMVGIKCHPGFGQYVFREKGDVIFEFAKQHKRPILSHGQANAWCCDVIECVEAADRHPDVNLILAHLGLSSAHLTSDLHIEAVRRAKHGNVYIDCSFLNTMYVGLLEKAVRILGSKFILFGTDSPGHNTSIFTETVRTANISDSDKEDIFHRNAERLLGI
jgi:predicted TIM-barrel fold metal-dependent hydrolase